MAMQTREQHIRREKATSNVCTAQALLANMTALFGIWHRPTGLIKIADRLRFRSQLLMKEFDKLEIKYLTDKDTVFDTIAIDCLNSGFSSSDWLLSEFHKHNINLRKIDDFTVGISFNETTAIQDCADIIEIFAVLKGASTEIGWYLPRDYFENIELKPVPDNLIRKTKFMQQQVFTTITSETDFMRYITRLGDRDISLANGMVPLGSCTMKLNAASAMLPITFTGFANMHPFAPSDQTNGYKYMIQDLEEQLSAIT